MNWKCLFFHDWVYLDTMQFCDGFKDKKVCVRCNKVVDEIDEHVKESQRKRLIAINKNKLAQEIFDEYSKKR
jgi:hypothetical protein